MHWRIMLCCAVIAAGGCWVRSRAGAPSAPKPVPAQGHPGSARPVGPAASTRPAAERSAGVRALAEGDLVPLAMNLPRPVFSGTPRRFQIPASARLDPRERAKYPRGELVYACMDPPPARLLVPKGTALLSKGKAVRLSDDDPIIGEASMVADGHAGACDGNWVELPPGTQWVQVDLGAAAEVWAVAAWHDYLAPRVYRDVVIQLADDA